MEASSLLHRSGVSDFALDSLQYVPPGLSRPRLEAVRVCYQAASPSIPLPNATHANNNDESLRYHSLYLPRIVPESHQNDPNACTCMVGIYQRLGVSFRVTCRKT